MGSHDDQDLVIQRGLGDIAAVYLHTMREEIITSLDLTLLPPSNRYGYTSMFVASHRHAYRPLILGSLLLYLLPYVEPVPAVR